MAQNPKNRVALISVLISHTVCDPLSRPLHCRNLAVWILRVAVLRPATLEKQNWWASTPALWIFVRGERLALATASRTTTLSL